MDEMLKKYLPQINSVPVEELNDFADNIPREDIPRILYDCLPDLTGNVNTVTILVCCTGSVATIKLPELVTQLKNSIDNVNILIVLTEKAKHFCDGKNPLNFKTYTDTEWQASACRLHEELVKIANLLLIAPLDANSLAKIANGICDNLLTSVVRIWDFNNKIAISCPAMNTQMWSHPITEVHLKQIQDLGFSIIQPITKKLACGDYGVGAMAEPHTIVSTIKKYAEFEGNKKWYEAYTTSTNNGHASIASRLSAVHF